MSDEKILSVDENGFAIEVDISEFEECPLPKLFTLEESIGKVLELVKEVSTRHDSEFNDYNIAALEASVETIDEPVAEPVYVAAVITNEVEDRTQHLRAVREMARKEMERNKIKLNPNTKAHLDKHMKQFDGSCQSSINRTGASHERNPVASILALDESKKNHQEAINNISAITKTLLKQLEMVPVPPPPPPVKKTWKEKVWDKVSTVKTQVKNKKRDIFFSVVKHAQKALRIKD